MSMEIKSATLLTIEEAETLLTKEVRKYNCWWWLKTPGYNPYAVMCVCSSGSLNDFGFDIHNNGGCVRPALEIDLKSSNLNVGDTFQFGNKNFKIISETMAFCLGDIGKSCFRKKYKALHACHYETSDVKKFIDEWFEKEGGRHNYE